MEKMMKKRGMSAILAMVMTVSVLLAAASKTEAAADGTTITLGAGALSNGSAVWFGTFNNNPVQWRVMGAGNDGGGNSKLLLSEYVLDSVQFNPMGIGNAWQGSNAQSWCVTFYNRNLTAGEQAALVKTSKQDGQYTIISPGIPDAIEFGPSALNDEYVFFLSAKEANETYFTDSGSRVAHRVDDPYSSAWWWLRSPDKNDSVGAVNSYYGIVQSPNVHLNNFARPAFNLNLSSVLFSSEITSETHKLTLYDTSRTVSITPGKTAERKSAAEITVPYTIDSGSNYVSLLITNKDDTWTAGSGWSSGAKKQYYTTAVVTGTSGEVTFTLPDNYDENRTDWKVWLLAEKVNGANLTDYAGTPVELTVPYLLKYDSNRGSGSMASQIVNVGDTFTFPQCGFKAPMGKTFDHWKMTGVDGVFYPDVLNNNTVEITGNCVQNGVITVTANWKEAPPATVKTAPQAKNLSYIGSAQELVAAGTAEGGTMQYALGTDAITAPTTGWTGSVPSGKEVGTYYVWYYVASDKDHSDTSPIPVPVTIGPNGSLLVYNGSAQELVKAGEATGGTMQYALGTDDQTAPVEGWGEAIPTGTDAGTYYVWYMVKGDQNHENSEPACVKATIAKKGLTVTADAKSKTQGEADPALTYTASGLVGSDTITGALSREAGEDPGTYQITLGSLTAGDNYEITFTSAVLTINKKQEPAPEPSPEPAPSGGGGGGYYGGGSVSNQPRAPYSDVIGAAATSCGDTSPERIHNIELACEKLNGIVLQPGETFSFHEAVGPFTAEAGFVLAPVDPEDETTAVMGGGISQVSSTLYAGSLFSLLETVERTNHPFPVSFTQPGTDALVTNADDGSLDLKFRNTRTEPIRIVAACKVDEATNIPEIRIGIQSALTASDYMPILFDNTWAGDRDAFLTETPYDPTRPGYRILLTHEEQAFTDDKGAGFRTLTHRKILDAAGMLVRDEILNSKLPDGSYAIDTYYLG